MRMPYCRRSHYLCATLLLFFSGFKLAIAAEPFVYGGKAASNSEAPWQTVLYLSNQGPYSGLLCAGTVIASRWVLTAAHCFFNAHSGARYPAHYISVAFGSATLKGKLTPLKIEGDPFIHKDYAFGVWDGDIALVRLSQVVTVEPIALASPKDEQGKRPTNYRVTGWGRTETGQNSNQLLYADIPMILPEQCRIFPTYQTRLTERLFCAGVAGRDTCKGDSGGPIYESLGEGYAIQFGTTTAGEGCGVNPGVYSRITKYREWISATIAMTGDKLIEPNEVREVANRCTPERVRARKC